MLCCKHHCIGIGFVLLQLFSSQVSESLSCLSQVSLKVLNTRPEPAVNPSEEEVSIRLSILPIRLNIDQVLYIVLP